MGKEIISGYHISSLSMGNLIALYKELRLQSNSPLELRDIGIPLEVIRAMGFNGWEDLQMVGEEAAHKDRNLQGRPRPVFSSSTGHDASQGPKNRTEDYEPLLHSQGIDGWEEPTLPDTDAKKPATLQGIAPTNLDPAVKKPTTLRGMAPTEPTPDLSPAIVEMISSLQPSVPDIEHLIGREQAAPDSMVAEFDAVTPSQIIEVSDIPGSERLAPSEGAGTPVSLVDKSFKVVLSPLRPELMPRQDPNDKFLDLFAAKHEPARPTADTPRSEYLEIMAAAQQTSVLPPASSVEQAGFKETGYADSETAIVKPLEQKKKGLFASISDWRRKRKEQKLDDVVQQLYAQKAAIENPAPQPPQKRYSVVKKVALAASLAVAAAAVGAISAAYHSFTSSQRATTASKEIPPAKNLANITAALAVQASSAGPSMPRVTLEYAAQPCNDIELRLNMHFDSTRFIDKDAKSKIESFLLEAVKKGHKDIYIYGFASIEGPNDRGNPKNNDDQYNMNLARQRMLAGKDVSQQAAFKHELDVNFITLMNYGEIEVYGKDFAPNRTLLMTTRPVRKDPDKFPSVGKELAKYPAGRINTGLCPFMIDEGRPITPTVDDNIKGNTPPEHGSLMKRSGSLAYLFQSIAPNINLDEDYTGYEPVEDSQMIEETPIADSVMIDKSYEAEITQAGESIVRHDAKVMIDPAYERELHEEGVSIERSVALPDDRPVSASGTIESIAKAETDKVIIDPAYEKDIASAGYAVEREEPKVIVDYQQPKLSVVPNYSPKLSCSADTRAALDGLSGIIATIQPVSNAQAKAAKVAGGNSDLADALTGIYSDSSNFQIDASSMLYNAQPLSSDAPAATQQSLLDMLEDKYGSTDQKDHLIQDILYPLNKAA